MPSKKPFVETRILDDMLEMASAMQDHALISKPDQYFPIEVGAGTVGIFGFGGNPLKMVLQYRPFFIFNYCESAEMKREPIRINASSFATNVRGVRVHFHFHLIGAEKAADCEHECCQLRAATDRAIFELAIRALLDGNSIHSTAGIVQIDKDIRFYPYRYTQVDQRNVNNSVSNGLI